MLETSILTCKISIWLRDSPDHKQISGSLWRTLITNARSLFLREWGFENSLVCYFGSENYSGMRNQSSRRVRVRVPPVPQISIVRGSLGGGACRIIGNRHCEGTRLNINQCRKRVCSIIVYGKYHLSLIRSRKCNWLHVGSSPIFPTIGDVAQLVERGPEEPRVGGSTPPISTIRGLG